MGMSPLQLTTAALGNLFDSEEDARNAEIVAQGLVPEPLPPQPKSNLRLVFESLVPGLAAGGAAALRNVAFGGRRRRRGQGFGQTFLQGLLAGAPPALLRGIDQRRGEQRGFETAQRQRESDVLRSALGVGEAARRARPQSLNATLARRVQSGEMTLDEALAAQRGPQRRLVQTGGGEQRLLDPLAGEILPTFMRERLPQLGAPPIGGPLIESEQQFDVRTPVRLQGRGQLRSLPRGGIAEVTGDEVNVLRPSAPRPPRKPRRRTPAERREQEKDQASEALGEILNMPNVNQNPQAAAAAIRSNRILTPAQKIILLELLEKQSRLLRGIDPTAGRSRGQSVEQEARRRIGQ